MCLYCSGCRTEDKFCTCVRALLRWFSGTVRASNQSAQYSSKVPHCDLQVVDHYEKPRNVGSFEKGDVDVGTGLVGAPACGDVMRLQIRSVSFLLPTFS